MALEEILSALGNHKELAEEVKSIFDANQDNVERIGGLESKIREAIDKKDRVLKLVRENLGISEVSEDTLSQFAKDPDEALKADKEALQTKLGEMNQKLHDTESEYNKKIDTMVLKDTLRGLGVKDRVANEVAFGELTNIVLAEAERDGAKFVFKDEDGRTRFTDNGKPMTVEDRIDELSRGDRSYLFNQPAGGGTPPSGTQQHTTGAPKSGVANYVTDMYL